MAEKVCEDGTTDLDEAVLNQFLNAVKVQVKVNYVRILFTAATNTPTVVSGTDSDGEIVDGDLAWDAGDTEINVTISGYSNTPVVLVSPTRNWQPTNCDRVTAVAESATNVAIRFISGADNTAVDPDGDISVNLLVIGF